MGFMDKARAAASDLAAKADTALANSGLSGSGGEAARYFHDLGVLTYLAENGRPGPAEEHERVMGALRELEARGTIGSLALQTAPAPASTPPPPPGAAAPPPPPPGAAAPPPPPPSWATGDDAQG